MPYRLSPQELYIVLAEHCHGEVPDVSQFLEHDAPEMPCDADHPHDP